jgi:hypothetical protein
MLDWLKNKLYGYSKEDLAFIGVFLIIVTVGCILAYNSITEHNAKDIEYEDVVYEFPIQTVILSSNGESFTFIYVDKDGGLERKAGYYTEKAFFTNGSSYYEVTYAYPGARNSKSEQVYLDKETLWALNARYNKRT